MSPGFHNLLQFLVQLLGFMLGAICGGLLVLAAGLLPLANDAAKLFVLMSAALLAWLCAAGGAVGFTRMFRARVFAKCPKCGGKASAEGWAVTRFRCRQCGLLDRPRFREGR